MSSLLRQEIEKSESVTSDKSREKSVKDGNQKADEDEDSNTPATYTVQQGDTLMRVSLATNLSIPTLRKYNKLYGRNRLFTGQVLRLSDPASQPSTWTDSSDGQEKMTLEKGRKGGKRGGHEFEMLKNNSVKNISFIEKERLKTKPITPRNVETPPLHQSIEVQPGTTPTLQRNISSTRSGMKASRSFKYKCNSNPDLKSMVDQKPPSSEPKKDAFRRQSLVGDQLTAYLSKAPHDTAISIPSQPQPEPISSSYTISSIPKALLHGTMEIFESYFPGSFTPITASVANNEADISRQEKDQVDKISEIPQKYRSFHTQLHGSSAILLHSHIQCLVEHFPSCIQHEAWELLYSTELHGSDLASFYHRARVSQYSLIVIKTVDHQVFGGFATEPWKVTKHGREAFYGTGESFLYKCHPYTVEDEDECSENENVDVYVWQYDNYFFQWSNPRQIAMGGGGNELYNSQ